MGAWIETTLFLTACFTVKSPLVWGRGLKHGSERDGEEGVEVAPRVGAWIETLYRYIISLKDNVAPRVGAWIET